MNVYGEAVLPPGDLPLSADLLPRAFRPLPIRFLNGLGRISGGLDRHAFRLDEPSLLGSAAPITL